MSVNDGMNYAPKGKPRPVVGPGEFVFAAAFLEHGHIFGQCNGLIEAGATLKCVYDSDPRKIAEFHRQFPGIHVARSFEEILDDKDVKIYAVEAQLTVLRFNRDPSVNPQVTAAIKAILGI